MKHSDIPEFGVLSGLRVVCVGPSVAGPFAASMMADHGADVIFLEGPKSPDIMHFFADGLFNRERKNGRSFVLDCTVPAGQDVLLRLLKDTDILIEVGKGGQWERWGLPDERLWEANPALVIAHVSGYGQTGVEEYVKRAGFDGTGQAFGGTLALNGEPDPAPPALAQPSTADYTTALITMAGCLAALYRAQKTGVGESLDVAQFEAMAKVNQSFDSYIRNGMPYARTGAMTVSAGMHCFLCKDGKYVFIVPVGVGVLPKVLKLCGLDPDLPEYKRQATVMAGAPGSAELEEALAAYCSERTAAEVDTELNDAGIPCSLVMTPEDMLAHPHVQARETYIQWDLDDGTTFTSVNAMPKMKRNPGKVWRAAPAFGADNRDIFEEMGYSDAEVAGFYEAGITSDRLM